VALRHDEFTSHGAVVAAVDVDSVGQHAAMVDKLNLPFPFLSDPDRSLAIGPFDLMNTEDPRDLALPATIVIGPDGDEVLRIVSRDFADRPMEEAALEAVQALGLGPVQQPPPNPGTPDPGPRAMPFSDMRTYFRGAKFGATAMGLRTGDKAEAKVFSDLMDHYMEDVVSMFRIIRDRNSD